MKADPIPRSLKRAVAVFGVPGAGRTTVVEDAGAVDSLLREAIIAAHKEFFRVYLAKVTA